jgi:hypothetical protein
MQIAPDGCRFIIAPMMNRWVLTLTRQFGLVSLGLCLGMALMTPTHAGNYPLGSMTCEDIGRFASEGMRWREQGLTPREAMARLQQLQPEGSVEFKNMRTVLMLIWGGYGDAWTVESAGDTMRKDCEAGR